MKKFLCLIFTFFLLVPEILAYKVFYYDGNGNRVYRRIEQKDFAKYKNAPRRAYIRKPRTNWEITDSMRARKRTSSQMTHRNCVSYR